MDFQFVKIEVYIPEEYVKELRLELNKIGALTVDGKYDYCMSVYLVKGSWRALEGANPFLGEIGEVCETEEFKVEFNCKKELIKEVMEVIKRVHPYEIPVINVLPQFTAY